MSALPTAKHEAWRYSDHAAVARLWPVPDALTIEVPAGERRAHQLTADDGVHDLSIALAAGARLDIHLLNAATGYARVSLDVTLGEGAHLELGAAQIGGGEANLEIVTTVRHLEPNASSRQLVRSVLAGRATGTYLGKVAVSRGAQKTDSEQSVRAMLLDRGATANAKPELEIHADDVKCAHGAAIGELDRQALFYLASRGLPPAEARTLLLRAFVAEAFAGAADTEALQAAALAALERLA